MERRDQSIPLMRSLCEDLGFRDFTISSSSKKKGGLGFRDFQLFNDAFRAKLGWRLINYPQGLLGRTLLGKYCPDGDFLKCKDRASASHGWKSIMVGRELLLNNMSWVVGDGQSINLWNDPWINLNQQERLMGPATETNSTLMVASLFKTNSTEWDLGRIRDICPNYEDQILRIKPSTTGAPDKMFWIGTKTGEFSIKSGYECALTQKEDTQTVESNENWYKNVWNLPTAPKVKMMIWKALRGALPVNARLVERRINIEPACKRCGANESILHLFFQCPFAREVWTTAPFTTEIDYSGRIDFLDHWTYVKDNTCLPPSGIIAGNLAPWIMWILWTSRNKLVFNEHRISEGDALSTAIRTAREWQNGQAPEKGVPKKKVNSTPNATIPTVVRSDAAWKKNLPFAGLGWCIIDKDKEECFTRTEPYVYSPLTAEGIAMREGLYKCRELNITKIRVESDSKQLINCINNGVYLPEIYGVISDILSLASLFEECYFGWISRDHNVVADGLAKQCLLVNEALIAPT